MDNETAKIKIRYSGDRALTVVFGERIDETVNEDVMRFCARMDMLRSTDPRGAGLGEVIPCFCSALVNYRPERISSSDAVALAGTIAEEILSGDSPEGTGMLTGRTLLIPCCYGGHFGPDMAAAEKLTGLTREEIISIHSGTDYRVYMLGFLPGFVYLGGLDPRLELPRLKTPRVRIPRGSVGIGGQQTGVYPMDSPGGWQLLGATPVDFYDPDRDEPILCRAGDRIRFFPVTSCDYYDIRQEILKGGKGWRSL